MYLSWSICNNNRNEVVSGRCKVIYEEVPIKIYFFFTKTYGTVNFANKLSYSVILFNLYCTVSNTETTSFI